jgi:hypothetical protein
VGGTTETPEVEERESKEQRHGILLCEETHAHLYPHHRSPQESIDSILPAHETALITMWPLDCAEKEQERMTDALETPSAQLSAVAFGRFL